MSANADLEDVASSSKDDESNTVPDATTGSSCKASGDTDDSTTVEQPSLTHETGVPELQSLEQSSIDKPIEVTTDETVKLGAGVLGSLIDTKATLEISNNKEISLKDTDILKDHFMENLKPLTSTSYSESIDNNGTNLKNIAKSTTEIAGYKETAIDDASDSDLELHWTDDDDDEDDQIDAHTSCDQALKQLDRELNIVDVETDTNEVEGEKSTAQDSETMDNIPTAVEKKHEYLESGRVKIDSNIQSLDKQLLKPFDNVQGIDDDKKLVDKSIDTAVAELQQLIDGDDNIFTEKTQSKCSEEESKPVVCGSATVSISTNNFVSLDVDEPTDIDVSPTSSHTNDIYLDIGVKEHDVIATAVADITDPITMSNCVDDNTVSNEVDEGMNSNDNKETTLNIQTKMDDIASKNVITSIGVKDHIDRNDGKKNAVIVEIISKDNILNESNDHKIDDSNTEIKINNDGANAMDKGIADRQISDIDAKDSLKCLTVNISDGKVSTECVDESMDSNDVAELVPEFRKNDAEIKDKDSNNIMTECENMISNTDTSKSLKENVDKSIHNTEFISLKTQKIEITNKDDGKVLTKCDGRVIVSDDIAETIALETAVKDLEGKTKHDRETLQGFVDQEMEDNDSTRTVNSKMQASEVNVIGADDDKIPKGSDQTLNDSDNKETALKMQTDNEAVTNVTNIEILKESDGQIMHGNDNTDLVSNMQISKVNILNADSNILNKSNNQNVDDNDKAGLKIQNTSNAVDKKTFHKSDSQIVCDHDANADIIGSKVEINVACVAEDNISSKTENHAVEVSGNTEMVLKLETDKVDRTSATSGKTINKSNDQSLNVDTDIDIGSKIQSYKVDTACVAEDNISREAEVHAVDASNSIKTVSIIDKDDLSSMTDDKASKESIEINKAESNTDKFDIQIADIKMSEGQAMDGEDKTKRDSKIQFGKVDVASKFASIIEMQEVDTRKNVDSVKNVETTDVIPVKADEFITPDTTSDSIKINKDHRITRPDVMLDIPTQEFDFDDEYNDTNEKEAPLERMNEDASDMTSKTVTEIVNQLAKDMSPEKKVLNKNAGKLDVSIDATEVKLDSEINAEKQEVLEKVLIKNTAVKKTSSVELANKVIAKEKNNADNETAKTEEKDLKPTELYTKAVEVGDSKPSTSEVAKMTPDTLEEAQDVTDSLLAESSRVLDDDEEEDEPEPDDDGEDGDDGDDDDDDFRPEDDNSNQTEESNSRHSEMDIQEEGIDIVFGNEADGIGLVSDSNDAEDAFNAALLGDTADITVEENDPVPIVPTTSVPEAKDDQQKAEPEIVDSEKEEQPIATAGKKTTTERRKSLLKDLLSRQNDEEEPPSTLSTIKLKKLDISCASNIVNIVDLEESSSEDDKESKQNAPSAITTDKPDQGTVDMLKSVALKRPSTDCESVAPSSKDKVIDKDKAKDGEVFNLDSDDDSSEGIKDTGKPRENNQCINHNCVSMSSVPYYLADRVTVAYYGAARKRRRAVCQNCLDIVRSRNEGLLAGIKDFRPLMSLRMARPTQQLLEISDSDSEGEDDPVGEEGAKIIEEQLADLLNQSWYKYKLDDRLKETEEYLEAELEKMQKQSEEIDVLLKDCQKATDRLRVEFYSGFEPRIMELPAISLHDTPIASYTCLESEEDFSESSQLPMRYPKRRSSTAIETPAKKQAIPMGYTDMEIKTATRSSREASETNQEEDKDISVVRLSAESAPADLPPPGELVRPPLRAGQQVYAMKNQYGAWLKGKVLETLAKTSEHQYTQCRIRFDHKVKNPCKTLSARSIAYTEPSEVRMTIGTRVIALFKNSENTNKRVSFYYSGVIAEIPNPVNSYRYLVFFDDGYAQYVPHMHTRLVCESSALVWEEVHPFSRDFVCNYLMKYPERPMVRMHQGQSLTVEWNGKWWDTKVIEVDAALVKVNFPDNRTEWIYRGSTRLQPLFAELQAARGGNRARLPRSTKANTKTNMPYVEYTRSEDQTNKVEGVQSSEELRKQRSVAKKSTTASTLTAFAAADGVVSRVVFYTPKNSVRPYKMVPHTCGPHCNRKDLLSLKELRTYNPLTKPLLSGWERQIVRHKYNRTVMYRAPCGRRVRSVRELHRYLRAVRSDMAVDLFDFSANTHCLAEFVLNKTNVQKKDLSHGKENVPVPCVNYYDHSLPEFCSYNTERTPTAGVPLNLDPEFLCGCDCEDDCVDKRKCACWKMTLEGARTIGIEGTNVGYEYRRLPEPLPSGIYECNSRCKCKATCMNRVVQNPLQLKLQVFKTLNRGWGIRALNDVPKGAFLCIYAGNLLTDATANLDGLNEGDEYLAELDYIEVVESMKEGYEEDIPEADKILDKKDSKKSESELESESTDSGDEEKPGKSDEMDDDFQPGYLSQGIGTFNKRLRRRDKKKNKEEAKVKAEDQPNEEKKKEEGGECITISDDEEVRESQREPSRFTAQEGMSDSKVVSKYRSIRTYFGKDEACYIMDAKVQGNIGRYLNHSCSPNVFVQNVFVDTHDPRFPWVSFFALHHIRAGTELTWNYNYDIGSVPGKVLYCFCGAPNCRGRLL